LHLGLVGDEIMNPKIMDSSKPIITKTQVARDISAYTATQSTICGVGESVNTFPRTTHRCAEWAYGTTCSTID